MAYKLIAFDMDGTMLDENKNIPQRNLDAVEAAAKRGCYIVPATGRMVDGIPATIRELPYVRYYITMNGALIWDEAEKKTIYESNMPVQQVIELYEYLDSLPVIYDCYYKSWGYISEDMFDMLDEYFERTPQMLDYVKSIRIKVPEMKAALKEWGGDVQKLQIYFRAQDEELRQQLLKTLPEKFPEMVFTSSLVNNIEVNSLGAGKDKALAALCETLDIELSESLAFGDGSNDAGMLKAAGLGVCMANGCEDTKAAADDIALCNDLAGLGIYVENLLEAGKI